MSTIATTPAQPEFISAVRINHSLTASVEKRALLWLAAQAPRCVTSDQLTALGFAAQIAAGVCYALARYDRRALLLVILCLALNWLGDSLAFALRCIAAALEKSAQPSPTRKDAAQ